MNVNLVTFFQETLRIDFAIIFLNVCVSCGRVLERMRRSESCFRCGNMKRLLSCLLLASHCALSSRSHASALRAWQSSDLEVFEGQPVRISCCWKTGKFERVQVRWLKNATVYKLGQSFQLDPRKGAEQCDFLEWVNITREDSGTYVCKLSVDIPDLAEARGNGTVVTVMRQRSNATAKQDKSESPLWVPLGISLAAVVFLLLVLALACICKLKQMKGVSRVIYESRQQDSDDASMDKRSSGGSSVGSSQWCQVVVYESVDYFERTELKQSE